MNDILFQTNCIDIFIAGDRLFAVRVFLTYERFLQEYLGMHDIFFSRPRWRARSMPTSATWNEFFFLRGFPSRGGEEGGGEEGEENSRAITKGTKIWYWNVNFRVSNVEGLLKKKRKNKFLVSYFPRYFFQDVYDRNK